MTRFLPGQRPDALDGFHRRNPSVWAVPATELAGTHPARPDTWAVCGFVHRSLSPDEFVVAILAIPGAYRETLGSFGSLDRIDGDLRDRPDASGWSALERITHVADLLHTSAKCVVAILEGDRHRRAPVHVDAPRAP